MVSTDASSTGFGVMQVAVISSMSSSKTKCSLQADSKLFFKAHPLIFPSIMNLDKIVKSKYLLGQNHKVLQYHHIYQILCCR